MQTVRSVLIHPSVRASAFRHRRIESLRTGMIDPTFHYAAVKQAELWLRVHQLHAPGSVQSDFRAIYRDLADDLARSLAGQAVHVIGLGSGGGEKEAWILEALHEQGCTLRYTPVDVSPELALLSAEMADRRVHFPVIPLVGHLSLLEGPPDWLPNDDPAEIRVYTAFGLTPNLPPDWLPRQLARQLRTGDQLLISANLAPTEQPDQADYLPACRRLMSQYDNPETLAWLRQALIDWGIAPLLSEPHFDLAELQGVAGFFATSHWLDDTRFDWEGLPFTARAGEPLLLFYSLRYTPARLARELAACGLTLGTGYVTGNGEEGVWRVWQ